MWNKPVLTLNWKMWETTDILMTILNILIVKTAHRQFTQDSGPDPLHLLFRTPIPGIDLLCDQTWIQKNNDHIRGLSAAAGCTCVFHWKSKEERMNEHDWEALSYQKYTSYTYLMNSILFYYNYINLSNGLLIGGYKQLLFLNWKINWKMRAAAIQKIAVKESRRQRRKKKRGDGKDKADRYG